jgi:hypothetical protein
MDPKIKKQQEEERRRRRKEYLARPPKGYENHPKPVTRRDFLAHGLIDSMAILSIPPVLRQLLSIPEVRAEAAQFLFAPDHVVLIFNWMGGAGGFQQAAFASRRANGDLLPGPQLYQHGIAVDGTTGLPPVNTTHGAWLYTGGYQNAAQSNPFYGTLQAGLPAPALERLRFATMLTNSADDTSNGNSGALGVGLRTFMARRLERQYLLAGGVIASGGASLTARMYASGTNFSAEPLDNEDPRLYTAMRDPSSLQRALERPLPSFTAQANTSILDALSSIARSLKTSRNSAGGVARAEEYERNASATSRNTAAINGNFSFLQPNTVLDALTRTRLAGAGPDAALLGSLFSALFSGASLPLGVYLRGGGDHHDATYTTCATQTAQAANVVAAFFNECFVRGIKGTLAFVGDGSFYAGRNQANQEGFIGDRGEYTHYWLASYSPTPREVIAPVGSALPGTVGSANAQGLHDRGSIVGSQRAAALAVLANIMDLEMGKAYREQFARMVPRNFFDAANLARVECFG